MAGVKAPNVVGTEGGMAGVKAPDVVGTEGEMAGVRAPDDLFLDTYRQNLDTDRFLSSFLFIQSIDSLAHSGHVAHGYILLGIISTHRVSLNRL